MNKKTNHLIKEKSPYLLQHAYNPINWFSWSGEAFEKAKAENKPIFLSIGYSTCHWCHVMAHESFEDIEVADLMNNHFIAIKVDREERPDIDSIYMTVCQRLTGQGGWPLTILMTPDQIPFYAGTYFPKDNKYGKPGLLQILKSIGSKWYTSKDEIIQSGNRILESIKDDFSPENSSEELTKTPVKDTFLLSSQMFDSTNGGFGDAPKFPSAHKLMFLLRFGINENMINPLEMVEKTLNSMFKGGIYDHIGYGFSRYATDEAWLIPHFEKMLYDNALLLITYLETYEQTKNPLYKTICVNTFEYILTQMASEEGGFYSAEDADSDGIEGKFYVFKPAEILVLLGDEDGAYFNNYYGVTPEGNFEGSNILNLIDNYAYNKEDEKIKSLRYKVFEYRNLRTKLHKDDKILTSWNALMITALAKGYKVLGDEKYLHAAKKALNFIKEKLTNDNGRLLARFRDGDSKYLGYLDDYAYLVWSLMELYNATFDVKYLKEALKLNKDMIDLFWDTKNHGFFLNGRDSKTLIANPKDIYDGALPSGNSVASFNLVKLYKLTADKNLEEYAFKQLTAFYGTVKEMPIGYSFYVIALMEMLYPSKELVVVANDNSELEDLKITLKNKFTPNLTIVVKTKENEKELENLIPFTKNYTMKNDKTTYYLCTNGSCNTPSNNLNEITLS
ncbi:thioredoxin domain-containing protein [Clostridium gasigenes]|uniref:thioredoxin domain-containing protein n=1 Tax=Clostridium gasigenes TaxID=94869 RepID=UPI001C0B69A9|nr:thioredoxin domain-containing protein [Clostridium gasigenes]MBU3102517.1 thioredoxin domain-containing protein [Clostridium gasigenes]